VILGIAVAIIVLSNATLKIAGKTLLAFFYENMEYKGDNITQRLNLK